MAFVMGLAVLVRQVLVESLGFRQVRVPEHIPHETVHFFTDELDPPALQRLSGGVLRGLWELSDRGLDLATPEEVEIRSHLLLQSLNGSGSEERVDGR